MNIKAAEKRLLEAAASGDTPRILSAAVEYGKAKIKGWRNRDRWKRRKRLQEDTGNGAQE